MGSPSARMASGARTDVMVAVDCNGADLGPTEVAAGAVIAAGRAPGRSCSVRRVS